MIDAATYHPPCERNTQADECDLCVLKSHSYDPGNVSPSSYSTLSAEVEGCGWVPHHFCPTTRIRRAATADIVLSTQPKT
jgi:hypothetical protein